MLIFDLKKDDFKEFLKKEGSGSLTFPIKFSRNLKLYVRTLFLREIKRYPLIPKNSIK